ncbi:MAG: aspartate-semialdehyde dehydrogenase [Bacteroidales bacterium]|jgi:aspartate-semialdehyde dehydrogenase|nr:aspartate-semialdehyde dehydrogenase [Bacteroidales bacterium]
MKVAVVGVTGLVGTVMLKVLEEFGYNTMELLPVASARSVGKTVTYFGKSYPIISIEGAIAKRPQIALFSAGGALSLEYAPKFAEIGTFVIDNSSAWRMNPEVPLVVPEINVSTITQHTKIIANPNCSTIQMVMALAPLHWKYGIRRVVVSTYQSVSGTGISAIRQLDDETAGRNADKVYPHQIHRNLFPHGGNFNADGYTTEEQKLVDETRKILSAPDMRITATVVRVPVTGGHSEAVNIEFKHDFELAEVRHLLSEFAGVEVLDEPENNIYPMPLLSEHKNETFVGRIRRDFSNLNSLNLWIVADNLRKGAATNAVQIMNYLIEQRMVNG